MIGLGLYKMTEADLERAIPAALDAGYRLFDTAAVYRNEEAFARILRENLEVRGIPRSAVFVTTKLSPRTQGLLRAPKGLEESLQKLAPLHYVDLLLIHWPGAAKIPPSSSENRKMRLESWNYLCELRKSKMAELSRWSLSNPVDTTECRIDSDGSHASDASQFVCKSESTTDSILSNESQHVFNGNGVPNSRITRLAPLLELVNSPNPVSEPLRVLNRWMIHRHHGDSNPPPIVVLNLGVSNYEERHLSEIILSDCDQYCPVLNQIEIHPLFHPQVKY